MKNCFLKLTSTRRFGSRFGRPFFRPHVPQQSRLAQQRLRQRREGHQVLWSFQHQSGKAVIKETQLAWNDFGLLSSDPLIRTNHRDRSIHIERENDQKISR